MPNGDYAAFHDAYLRDKGRPREATHGDMVTVGGEKIAEHAGAHHFTVGQRKGLGVAKGEPLYVIATDPAIAARDRRLERSSAARDADRARRQLGLLARTRGAGSRRSQDPQPPSGRACHPLAVRRNVEVRFDEPQRAVTPGPGRRVLPGRPGPGRRLDRITWRLRHARRICGSDAPFQVSRADAAPAGETPGRRSTRNFSTAPSLDCDASRARISPWPSRKSRSTNGKPSDGLFRSIGRVLLAFARFPSIHRELSRNGFATTATSILSRHGARERRPLRHRTFGQLGAERVLARACCPRPWAWWCVRSTTRGSTPSSNDAAGSPAISSSANETLRAPFCRRCAATKPWESWSIRTRSRSRRFVDFFGKPACSGTTFAKIAARSGAAVIPGFAFWSDEEQRHILHFYPEVHITGELEADTAAIQKAVEHAIREHPGPVAVDPSPLENAPPGEPPLYP